MAFVARVSKYDHEARSHCKGLWGWGYCGPKKLGSAHNLQAIDAGIMRGSWSGMICLEAGS